MRKKTLWHRLMRHMNYKPGWWALYFLYLLIPASCYVFYLYRRAKEVETVTLMRDFLYASVDCLHTYTHSFARLSLLLLCTMHTPYCYLLHFIS